MVWRKKLKIIFCRKTIPFDASRKCKILQQLLCPCTHSIVVIIWRLLYLGQEPVSLSQTWQKQWPDWVQLEGS